MEHHGRAYPLLGSSMPEEMQAKLTTAAAVVKPKEKQVDKATRGTPVQVNVWGEIKVRLDHTHTQGTFWSKRADVQKRRDKPMQILL